MKYLVAVLVDADQLEDDDGRPFESPAAVLAYMSDCWVEDGPKDGPIPSVRVVGDGAEEAFAAIGGLLA